jgi:hypothetical protein
MSENQEFIDQHAGTGFEYGEREHPTEVKLKSGGSAVIRFIDKDGGWCRTSWILCDDDKPRGFNVEPHSTRDD